MRQGQRLADELTSWIDRRETIATQLGDQQRLAALQGLVRLAAAVEAGRWALLRAEAASGGYRREGFASVEHWWTVRSGQARGSATKDARTAQQLASLPQVEQATATGKITADHARAITRFSTAGNTQRRREVLDEQAQRDLIATAASEDASRFAKRLERLGAQLDREGLESDHQAVRARRYFRLSPQAGGIKGEFLVDQVVGAEIRAAVQALSAPPPPGDSRTSDQRSADTLAAIFRAALDQVNSLPASAGAADLKPGHAPSVSGAPSRSQAGTSQADTKRADPRQSDTEPADPKQSDTGWLETEAPATKQLNSNGPKTGRPDVGRPDTGRVDTGQPDVGRPDVGLSYLEQSEAAQPRAGHRSDKRPRRRRRGTRTTVLVVMSAETLAAARYPERFGDRQTPPATFEDGTPIPDSELGRLLCTGAIGRVVVDAAGQTLEVGRTSRLATGAQRRALAARDRGCMFPGCDRPIDWSDIHHVVPWAAGGSTDATNLVSLCEYHHHTVIHANGFSVEPVAGGFAFRTPTGRHIGTTHFATRPTTEPSLGRHARARSSGRSQSFTPTDAGTLASTTAPWSEAESQPATASEPAAPMTPLASAIAVGVSTATAPPPPAALTAAGATSAGAIPSTPTVSSRSAAARLADRSMSAESAAVAKEPTLPVSGRPGAESSRTPRPKPGSMLELESAPMPDPRRASSAGSAIEPGSDGVCSLNTDQVMLW